MTEEADLNKEKSDYLKQLLDNYPTLRDRILRAFLIALHSREIITMDDLYQNARLGTEKNLKMDLDGGADNMQIARRWDEAEQEMINELTIECVAQSFTREEIEDVVNLTRKREGAQTISEIAGLASVSFRLLAGKVKEFCSLPVGQTFLAPHEAMAARVALIRYFISDHLEFIGVAKNHLLIRDFEQILDRMIGDENGIGKIGGKGAGMYLASRILTNAMERESTWSKVKLAVPDTHFLRADVLDTFLHYNGLGYLSEQKYKDVDDIRGQYPMIVQLFKNADFPPTIIEQLRAMLEKVGEHPLIVRSSSLLEDRFETAFAGMYRSVFVSNQGGIDLRLADLLGAVAEVYASAYHPDPIIYRRKNNLVDYHENMAVLIQKVVGTRSGDYYLPTWSGVAFSRNLYRRNPRVRPEDGLARLVFGLGTRAVDRVAADYPRLIALGMPTLRPEINMNDILRFSQKSVDVINLKAKEYQTVSLSELLRQKAPPRYGDVISIHENGTLHPAMGLMMGDPKDAVVTFDQFSKNTPYPAFIKWMLQSLEKAYGVPVEIEIACDGETLYLLQCRVQPVRPEMAPVRIPDNIPEEDKIFYANRDVMSGSVRGLEYVVVIDPIDYNAIDTGSGKLDVIQVVRQLNKLLADKRFILMGPGRWGSRDPRMGIRVGYSGINNTKMLIEIARSHEGFTLDASFGSHFFQELIESDIQYLSLHPEEDPGHFNEAFLRGAANSLPELLPEFEALKDVVRVIDVARVSGGRLLHVDLDGERQQALAYLA